MVLSELISIIPHEELSRAGEPVVSGISYDSRRISRGDVFVCIRGFKHDGHDFAPEAVEKGAVAAVVQRRLSGLGVPQVLVEDSRAALALLSAELAGHPSKKLRVVGVTGTNGKTTTTHFIREVLKASGRKADMLGTVRNIIGDRVLPVERTTPESSDLQALFESMVESGTEYAVMEVSSHALALGRVSSTEFDAAVFTNLTQDHLDFHSDIEDYLGAKAALFSGLGSTYRGTPKAGRKFAVLNADDPASGTIRKKTSVDVLAYGMTEKRADVLAENVRVERGGVRFDLRWAGRTTPLSMRVTGRFNVYNALAAACFGLGEGLSPESVSEALSHVDAVPGRFESVDEGQDFGVIVDYAHTPDGLANVLRTARDLASKRVIAVFGCGGDRDRAKRPMMGRIACELCDFVVVTSDNPRSEDPARIVRDIVTGIPKERLGRTQAILDRKEAIQYAIGMASSGDMVVIAGKGHETYQIFKDRTVWFDDVVAAREALRKCGRSS